MQFLKDLHITTSEFITGVFVVIAVAVAVWVCAYIVRVAYEFGKGIFLVLAIVLAFGLWLGPWFFSIVHAVGLH